MNVIIPMMGIGKRFTDVGYIEDKPFIKVNGKLLIELVVQPLLEMYGSVFIACRKAQADRLSKVFSTDIVKPIILEDSKGAAHTIQQSCKYINAGSILCVDSDTILTKDALLKINDAGNSIATFIDEELTGMYSYVELTTGNEIKKIVEKKAITDIANAGVYRFDNKNIILDNYKNINGKEQYLSNIVSNAIKNKVKFTSIDVSNQFYCLGTPHQLQSYCKKKKFDGVVFCFDLDKTLVYDTFKNPNPIRKNVDYCNYLYDNGAKIIIYTARGMLSYQGNQNSIKEFVYPTIKKVLSNCNIKYHELIIGKPYADYYIDDKAIPAYNDLQKETGVYYAIDTETRSHHNIQIQADCIIKTGNLSSENYYYKNLPKDILLEYFPTIIESNKDSITLERIVAPTYSNLLLNGKLKESDILVLLNCAFHIHNYIEVQTTDWGYNKKVLDRYVNNKIFYNAFGIDEKYVIDKIIIDNKVQGGIIHGDMVFTNVFHQLFIDPRGDWNDEYSLYGDIHYDYAKILQSLYGYDYALNNCNIQEDYLKRLRNVFYYWYENHYGQEHLNLIKQKTRLLILSMLPIHKEDIDRCRRFIKMLNNIV